MEISNHQLASMKQRQVTPQEQHEAIVLLDDILHLEKLASVPIPSAGDIRRVSSTLRRLLEEDHIQRVASRRVGRIELLYEDAEVILGEGAEDFRVAGLPPLFGWQQCPFGFFSKFFQEQSDGTGGEISLASDEPRRASKVKLSNFLNRPVARYQGAKISKRDMLQHVCYFDCGIHLNGSQKERVAIISEFKNSLTFREGMPGQMAVEIRDLRSERPDGAILDLAQAHTFGIAHEIINSPDIHQLKNILESEFR